MRLNLECLEGRANPSTFTTRVPPELWQALAADVRTLAEGTTAPSRASVEALVTATQAAAADGVITPREAAQISQAARTVLEEANVPPDEIRAVVADAQAIYVAWAANAP
ncbi:hypothetical protein R5W23_006242 [Gemmata sp. JC673]|uniref:Uncharacterized protein n=1 Tax=Gemmata algarum TaxID=2975278 RepID=A0ABU5EX62_9BACT|nr:hypothetical protein [Gemmata algarum]MDY3559052.1 hypothetical protein [Gemmata algarum]